MLFVSGREFSIEGSREKLRELLVQEADSAMRAAASVGSFELLQVLLKATQKLSGPAPAAASAPGVSVAEPERRIRSLERENADLREQRTIRKIAAALFSEPPR